MQRFLAGQRVLWALLLWLLVILPSSLRAATWQEYRSTHFRVLYRDHAAFAATVAAWAESYYAQIRLELGLNHVLQRDRVPWLWDERCHIYLYPDRQAYLQATGAPAWSGGLARYRQRVVLSFAGAPAFLERTLPHELAHLLFREYVGFANPHVPRWLDEGVAQYAERGTREQALATMRRWLRQGVYFPLAQLSRLSLRRVPGRLAQVFYTQAVTLVHFFLARYGSQRFLEFCSNLRDGYRLERALSFATAGSLDSLAALEAAWQQFVLAP